jgi:hypothetical protein
MQTPTWMKLVFYGLRGSHSHGTYIPPEDINGTDDIDYCGAYFAPTDHYIGVTQYQETVERMEGNLDVVMYEYRHFVRLLLKNNPNVLSWLWLNDDHVQLETTAWTALTGIRERFLSKLSYHTFTGYSYSQLKKMENMSPEIAERFTWLELVIKGAGYEPDRLAPEYEPDVRSWQHEYQSIKSKYMSGFMGDKRRSKVVKFGYDVKAASHLIRLLRMQVEILKDGTVLVDRTGHDAQELIAIKQGAWSLERVKDEANRLFELASKLVKVSKLPDKPDVTRIEPVVSGMLYQHIRSFYE